MIELISFFKVFNFVVVYFHELYVGFFLLMVTSTGKYIYTCSQPLRIFSSIACEKLLYFIYSRN